MTHLVYLLLITQWAFAQAVVEPDAHAHFRAVSPRTSLRRLIDPANWVGVIGDSGVTGAASSPELSANVFTLLNGVRWLLYNDQRLTGYLPPGTEAVTRVVYSQREFEEAQAKDDLISLNGGAHLSMFADVPEHAFPYVLAREMGVAASDVVVAAQDGKRVSAIPTQLERLFEMDTATLPPLVFVSFTANDFCDLKIFDEAVEERARRFRKNLNAAWAESKPFLRAHPNGTRFVVTAPLEVANVLANPSILAQEVPLGTFGTVTCEQMRRGDVPYGPLAGLAARKLSNMCPAVLGTRPDDVVRIQRLRDVQNAFNQVWKDQITALNRAYANENISWTYLEGARAIEFAAGDVSNECFHPSAAGHAKIAAYVRRHLRDVPRN